MKVNDKVKTESGTGVIIDKDTYNNTVFYRVQLDNSYHPPLICLENEIEVIE